MKNEVVCGKLIKQSDQGNARRSKQEVYEKDFEDLLYQGSPALFANRTLVARADLHVTGVACGGVWCDLIDLLGSMI